MVTANTASKAAAGAGDNHPPEAAVRLMPNDDTVFVVVVSQLEPVSVVQSVFSGNSPGIQRAASAAGKARRSGARVLSDVTTP
jgi:hypothetical protein